MTFRLLPVGLFVCIILSGGTSSVQPRKRRCRWTKSLLIIFITSFKAGMNNFLIIYLNPSKLKKLFCIEIRDILNNALFIFS